MRFFIDQCVPRSVSNFLKDEGHKTELLKNHLTATAPDDRVIRKAQQLNALLVSLNGDFADIVTYPPENYIGIISLQVRNRPEAIPHILQVLSKYLNDHPSQKFYGGKLLLVEPSRLRIRQ